MKFFYLILLIFITQIPTYSQSLIIQAKAYVDVRNGKLVKPANLIIKDGLIEAINGFNIVCKRFLI